MRQFGLQPHLTRGSSSIRASPTGDNPVEVLMVEVPADFSPESERGGGEFLRPQGKRGGLPDETTGRRAVAKPVRFATHTPSQSRVPDTPVASSPG